MDQIYTHIIAMAQSMTAPAEKPVEKTYRVTIGGLTKAKAEELAKQYGGTVAAE